VNHTRECGGCTACCEGHLAGTAYGIPFKPGKPCFYLREQKCRIYQCRPQVCHRYLCAWVQGLFPGWLKPTESGVLVSVEVRDKQQFLRVVAIKESIDERVTPFLDEWCKQNNTYYVMAKHEP